MSGGRTMWFALDVARHRRALMVELRAEHGPVALAVDTVLQAHAKEQNDGGRVRDGFAAIAVEAGCTREQARAFIVESAEIGWLDDLEIDADGRRFHVRVSGWKADQEKANAAWRKARSRAAAAERDAEDDAGQTVTDRDNEPASHTPSRPVTKRPPTAQHSTAHGEGKPSPSRAGARGAASGAGEDSLFQLADEIAGVLQRGVDSLTGPEEWPPARPSAVLAALRKTSARPEVAVAVANEVRAIAQSQNRAPNIAGLFASKLAAASSRGAAA